MRMYKRKCGHIPIGANWQMAHKQRTQNETMLNFQLESNMLIFKIHYQLYPTQQPI